MPNLYVRMWADLVCYYCRHLDSSALASGRSVWSEESYTAELPPGGNGTSDSTRPQHLVQAGSVVRRQWRWEARAVDDQNDDGRAMAARTTAAGCSAEGGQRSARGSMMSISSRTCPRRSWHRQPTAARGTSPCRALRRTAFPCGSR